MSIVDDLIQAFEDLVKVVKLEFQQKDARIAELEARLDESRRSNKEITSQIEFTVPEGVTQEQIDEENPRARYKKSFNCNDCNKPIRAYKRYYPGWKPRCAKCLRAFQSITGEVMGKKNFEKV